MMNLFYASLGEVIKVIVFFEALERLVNEFIQGITYYYFNYYVPMPKGKGNYRHM